MISYAWKNQYNDNSKIAIKRNPTYIQCLVNQNLILRLFLWLYFLLLNNTTYYVKLIYINQNKIALLFKRSI